MGCVTNAYVKKTGLGVTKSYRVTNISGILSVWGLVLVLFYEEKDQIQIYFISRFQLNLSPCPVHVVFNHATDCYGSSALRLSLSRHCGALNLWIFLY